MNRSVTGDRSRRRDDAPRAMARAGAGALATFAGIVAVAWPWTTPTALATLLLVTFMAGIIFALTQFTGTAAMKAAGIIGGVCAVAAGPIHLLAEGQVPRICAAAAALAAALALVPGSRR